MGYSWSWCLWWSGGTAHRLWLPAPCPQPLWLGTLRFSLPLTGQSGLVYLFNPSYMFNEGGGNWSQSIQAVNTAVWGAVFLSNGVFFFFARLVCTGFNDLVQPEIAGWCFTVWGCISWFVFVPRARVWPLWFVYVCVLVWISIWKLHFQWLIPIQKTREQGKGNKIDLKIFTEIKHFR